MFIETDSSPSAPYFLRKDKFFFSQENPVYAEQKAFLEEQISNLFFKKRRLLSLTSISKQIASTKLEREFKESFNLGLVSKMNQDKLTNTYCANKADIVQRLKCMLFTKGLYKQSVRLNSNKTIPFDTGFFSCVLALPLLPFEDKEFSFTEVLRVLRHFSQKGGNGEIFTNCSVDETEVILLIPQQISTQQSLFGEWPRNAGYLKQLARLTSAIGHAHQYHNTEIQCHQRIKS